MIIFVGPSLKPITGQSLAFDIISNHYGEDKKVFCYEGGASNKLLVLWRTFSIFMFFFFTLLFLRRVSALYLTTSRTPLGFFRDMLFILTANMFNIKIVNHLHGADFKEFRSAITPKFRKLVDYVYSKINISIVLLPKMKEQYDLYENMTVISISNCALPLANLSKNTSNYFNVLYLSNIMYSKGVLYVIEAIDNLVKSGVKVKLSIAGAPMGDDYKNIDEIQSLFQILIKDKGYISYLGTISGVEKDQILIDADVFVLPSFYKTEAQPISIIEAMLSGTAVITTRHNYLGDMVNSDNGFLINPRSTKEIESALLELKNDRTRLKTISDYNKSYAEKKYSLDRYVKEISAVLNG
jgi:glycosyltransferase involved in cell wall biosynthesis